MPRKAVYEQSFASDRWISSDPLDNEIIERLFKKDIREGGRKAHAGCASKCYSTFPEACPFEG
jgi:hypothetical protein